MGSCQMKNCRCICTQNRLNCSCGSQLSIALDEQYRDTNRKSTNRSNRFIRNQSIKRQKNNDSPQSSDTMKQTKYSTNYNMKQSKYYMYLLSEECNLSSESSIKKYSIKTMNFRSKTYFNPNDVYIETPKRKEHLYPSQTVPENLSSFEAFQAVETTKQINLSPSKSMKGHSSTDNLKVSQNLSLQQQMSAEYSLDRKQPKKGALKLSQNSNESFRTQQVKRKVRFNLPHSFYVRERQKQQQLFFK